MRSMATSCQNTQGVPASSLRGGRGRVLFFPFLCTVTALAVALTPLALSRPVLAAVGDGKAVYGESGSAILKIRDYANSGSSWDTEGNATTTATTHRWVVTQTSPQVDQEFIVASSSYASGAGTLYLSRWDGSGWNLDVTEAGLADGDGYRTLDLAYEQDRGNALAVYSTGNTTNELGYYYYVPTTTSWIGPCTLESTRTTGAVEWVELEFHPNTDEIVLVFSDANDDLSAFVWTPAYTEDVENDPSPATCANISASWGDEHTSALTTDLSEEPAKKFDVRYEDTSGDILVTWIPGSNDATVEYATNPGSGTGWTVSSSGGF